MLIGLDLRALIRAANGIAELVEDIHGVEGVRRLEPGARVLQIGVQRVGVVELIVDAVEDVLLVALVVQRLELGAVEKASGVQAADRDEVAPTLSAIGERWRRGLWCRRFRSRRRWSRAAR